MTWQGVNKQVISIIYLYTLVRPRINTCRRWSKMAVCTQAVTGELGSRTQQIPATRQHGMRAYCWAYSTGTTARGRVDIISLAFWSYTSAGGRGAPQLDSAHKTAACPPRQRTVTLPSRTQPSLGANQPCKESLPQLLSLKSTLKHEE